MIVTMVHRPQAILVDHPLRVLDLEEGILVDPHQEEAEGEDVVEVMMKVSI